MRFQSRGYKKILKGYCFSCNIFGDKYFQGNMSSTGYGSKKIVRCFKCFYYGHFENQCKLNLKSKHVWKPIFKKIEKSLIVEIHLFAHKPTTWVLDSDCSHHMIGYKSNFKTLKYLDGGFFSFWR